MGGLSLLCLPALIAAPAAQEPAPILAHARTPDGRAILLRLQFRRGLSVEGKALPRAFLGKDADPSGWVSFDNLSPEGKRWALAALFPEDQWRPDEVRHRIRHPEVESVWTLAALFTGHGQNYDKVMAANPDLPEKLREGDTWRIPRSLLSVDLGGTGKGPDRTQPEDELDDEARVAAYRAMLSFGEDAQGKYAAYRMRKGEALYSSVVIRYTDRVDPKGVNDLADRIARRTGIADVRGIQPGQLIKIPVDFLADPFQAEGSSQLAEEREVRAEVRRNLGIRFRLRHRHAGPAPPRAGDRRPGEQHHPLSRPGFQDPGGDPYSQPVCGDPHHAALRRGWRKPLGRERPPALGAGQRPARAWAQCRRPAIPARAETGSEEPASLHPSARGSMVYVPSAALVPTTFALGGAKTGHVAEGRRSARVTFTSREKLQGEARSRQFSETLMKALHKERIPVHANRPIRNVIYRSGGKWVPAVLRYSTGATKALVGNTCQLRPMGEFPLKGIMDPEFRERYAVAVVNAIRAYYRK